LRRDQESLPGPFGGDFQGGSFQGLVPVPASRDSLRDLPSPLARPGGCAPPRAGSVVPSLGEEGVSSGGGSNIRGLFICKAGFLMVESLSRSYRSSRPRTVGTGRSRDRVEGLIPLKALKSLINNLGTRHFHSECHCERSLRSVAVSFKKYKCQISWRLLRSLHSLVMTIQTVR
jgi:hypothetical protein